MKATLKQFILLTFIIFGAGTSTIKAEDKLTPYEWHVQTREYNSDFNKIIDVITNYNDYLKLIPNVTKMRIDSIRGRESVCYFEQQDIHGFFWTILQFKIDKKQTNDNMFVLKTKYIQGNAHPFESYIIVEKYKDNKTLVTTKMKVQYPGPSFIPDFIINKYIDYFMEKSLKNLETILK